MKVYVAEQLRDEPDEALLVAVSVEAAVAALKRRYDMWEWGEVEPGDDPKAWHVRASMTRTIGRLVFQVREFEVLEG